MASSEGSGRKWLACGCFGCLAVVALIVVVLALSFGTAWVGVRNERVAERTFEPELPGDETEVGAPSKKPGRVVLRLTAGEFHIEPGPSLRVEATYDERTYELGERFEDGPDHWTYEVDFERKGSTVIGLLKAMVGGKSSRVDVMLPADVPLELEMHITQGGSEMELGGLWLTSADIEYSQGGFELEVSDALREPMDSLIIRGSMGGFVAAGIGDASPRRLEVDCRMGGMELDLRGDWKVDSDVTIRTSQGGGELRLPRSVNIVGIDTDRLQMRRDEETPRPTLTFTVSTSQGELEILE